MTITFNPEMLAIARRAAGVSQADLAQAINVSQSKASKIENGLLHPADEEVQSIAAFFGRPPSFFGQSGFTQGGRASWYHHRRRRSLGQRKLQAIHATVDILHLEVARLLADVQVNVRQGFGPMDPGDHSDDRVIGVERVAQLVRARWGLEDGPIPDMTEAIERNGGVVLPVHFGTSRIDALSLMPADGTPLFFVRPDMPADRMRHTLAHEVGHLVMHDVDVRPERDMEREADVFAGEFLMPKRLIKSTFWTPLRLDDLLAMKERWGVSVQSLVMCAHRVGVIDHAESQRLFMQISKRGWRKREPLELPPERARLMRLVVDAHRDAGLTMSDLAELARTSVDRFKEQYLQGPDSPRLRVVPGGGSAS